MKKQNVTLVTLLLLAAVGGCKGKNKPGSGTPTPAPTPTPVVITRPDLNAVCNRIREGSGGGTCTPKQDARYMLQMQHAIYSIPDTMLARNGSPKNPKEFMDAVYKTMEGFGLCAAYDGEFITVRGEDNFTESYSFYIPYHITRLVESNVTCAPAGPYPTWDQTTMQFPRPPCNLPPSYFDENNPNHFCRGANQGQTSQYKGDVVAAVDQVIAEERANPRSDLFDFNDMRYDGPAFKHQDGNHIAIYLERIAGILRAKGYCVFRTAGTQDGVEVKKGSNTFSEYYDLVIGGEIQSVRKYFHSSCFPAGF